MIEDFDPANHPHMTAHEMNEERIALAGAWRPKGMALGVGEQAHLARDLQNYGLELDRVVQQCLKLNIELQRIFNE